MLQNPELHYLDNAATTIVAPEVADVIDKAMREHWANPSSLYGPGARSEEALNAARAAVARTLGCKAKELYFTSCGSESNNLALLGAARTRTFGKDIVVSGFEHPSVQRPLEDLAKRGYNVTVVKPRADGTLDINEMLEHVGKNTTRWVPGTMWSVWRPRSSAATAAPSCMWTPCRRGCECPSSWTTSTLWR